MAFPIVFSTNSKYLVFCAVAIQSILEHIESEDNFKFYILHTELSAEEQERILKMQKSNATIEFINVQNYFNFDKKLLKELEHYSKEMYNRVLIPIIFKDKYQKILYADCDMVFNINPKELFQLDMNNYPIGAVLDIAMVLSDKNYLKKLGLKGNYYFNSGLLLMNIPALNEFQLYEKFTALLQEQRSFKFPDQDMLNIILEDKIFNIDCSYNFQYAAYLGFLRDLYLLIYYQNDALAQDLKHFMKTGLNPKIIHYTAKSKPLHNHTNVLTDYFCYYALKTSYAREIILDELNYSELYLLRLKIKSKFFKKNKDYVLNKIQKIELKKSILKFLQNNPDWRF